MCFTSIGVEYVQTQLRPVKGIINFNQQFIQQNCIILYNRQNVQVVILHLNHQCSVFNTFIFGLLLHRQYSSRHSEHNLIVKTIYTNTEIQTNGNIVQFQ
ncbi:unnamed protein product [Paramecium octaurelia]|uniref:Uncharacterized protein n=1 Tax=Paramecium octaurelia TaxID=43137 RepID=A0A8S1YHA8_PAROT|nr:unnamed protein product [Paramecium octaurelia]